VTGTSALLEAGDAALAAGDWAAARTAYGEALDAGETAEGLLGLGTAHWWLGEVRESCSYWERAYAAFRRRPDPGQAATVAVGLSLVYDANCGNRAVAAGWSARAARLADDLNDPVLSAWVLLTRAATSDDPLEVVGWAEHALQAGAAAHDLDLELCALSTKGSALIDAGRVAEGTLLLDEALAGALGGEGTNLDTVVFTSCVLMRSCVRGADFLRVVQWSRALDRFIERYGCPYVHATCRACYGAVLVSTGDWLRAEDELAAALELAEESLPAVRAEALAYLADLRLAQGRVDEARRLLIGYEDRAVVLPVLAATYLAGGELELAVSTARQRLALAGARHLEEARLREVLGEAGLTGGDVTGAADQGRHLVELGARLGNDLVLARGERLLSRALIASAEAAEARRHLAAAQARFTQLEMPLEVARTRMALAAALEEDEPEAAVAEARIALTVFEDLGASHEADVAAAWLRAAGAAAARSGPRGFGILTRRERDVLAAVGEGLSNPEIAARLYISRRTVEHHVASVLSKLCLRNRAEAAAFVARQVGKDLAPK